MIYTKYISVVMVDPIKPCFHTKNKTALYIVNYYQFCVYISGIFYLMEAGNCLRSASFKSFKQVLVIQLLNATLTELRDAALT